MRACPACGFENADSAEWCDFCKDPFKKRQAEAEAAARAAAEAAAKAEAKARAQAAYAKPVPPEAILKLAEAARRPVGACGLGKPGEPIIPPEFAHLDPGERLSELPRRVRTMAWVFLGAVVFWIIVGSLWVIRKAGRIRAAAEAEGSAAAAPTPPPSRARSFQDE